MKPEELELLVLPKMMRAAKALYADIVKFKEGQVRNKQLAENDGRVKKARKLKERDPWG